MTVHAHGMRIVNYLCTPAYTHDAATNTTAFPCMQMAELLCIWQHLRATAESSGFCSANRLGQIVRMLKTAPLYT